MILGLVEQLNQTLCNALSKMISEQQTNWTEYVRWVRFSYNSCTQASLKKSPFEMVYGVHPNLPSPLEDGCEDIDDEIVDLDIGQIIVYHKHNFYSAQKSIGYSRKSCFAKKGAIKKGGRGLGDFRKAVIPTTSTNCLPRFLIAVNS